MLSKIVCFAAYPEDEFGRTSIPLITFLGNRFNIFLSMLLWSTFFVISWQGIIQKKSASGSRMLLCLVTFI